MCSINRFSESKIPSLAELKAFKNEAAAFSVLKRIVNVPEIPVSEEKSIPPKQTVFLSDSDLKVASGF